MTVAFVLSCSDTIAPGVDRIVAIEIRAEPDVDTVRLADSVTFTVWADTLAPSSVTWILEPAADTIVSTSLVYRPTAAGTTLIRVVAEFPDDRVGLADRRVVTPPNRPPSGTIELALPGIASRVPFGDTLGLVAVFTDPDGEQVEIRWWGGPAGATSLGTGDTLRLRTDTVGTYIVFAEARDPSGARGMARRDVVAYDPVTPFVWRTYVGPLDHLTVTDDDLIVAHCTGGTYAGPIAPVVAFDLGGRVTWTISGDCGPPPNPSIDGVSYVSGGSGTLRRISASGSVEWTLSDAPLGPIVLPDSSLVVRSTPGTSTGIRLRRVTSSGTVLWDRLLDSTLTWVSDGVPAAVGMDSSIYLVARSTTEQFLLRVAPDGTEQWRIPSAGGTLAVADDSTILMGGASLTAVRPDGTTRWQRALYSWQTVRGILVGPDDIAYASWGTGGCCADVLVAFSTIDGATVWGITGQSSIPVVLTSDGTLICSAGAELVGVDGATGTVRWRHATAVWPGNGFILTDAGLLVIPNNGYLEAVDLGVGPSDAPWPMAWGGNRRFGRRQSP